MNIQIHALVVGKIKKNWCDNNGNSHIFYELNIIQNDGETIAQLRVPENIYSIVEKGQEYVFEGIYALGRNGGYLKVTNLLK